MHAPTNNKNFCTAPQGYLFALVHPSLVRPKRIRTRPKKIELHHLFCSIAQKMQKESRISSMRSKKISEECKYFRYNVQTFLRCASKVHANWCKKMQTFLRENAHNLTGSVLRPASAVCCWGAAIRGRPLPSNQLTNKCSPSARGHPLISASPNFPASGLNPHLCWWCPSLLALDKLYDVGIRMVQKYLWRRLMTCVLFVSHGCVLAVLSYINSEP